MKKILLSMLAFFCVCQSFCQTIDRSKMPEPGPAPMIKLGAPVTYHLKNGMTILVVESHKVPKISATLFIDAGQIKEGKKAGVLDLMGQMLGEGTTTMSKAEFDEAVDVLGANLSFTHTGGSVDALTKYFPQAFELMSKGLISASFSQSSFDKIQLQVLTDKINSSKNTKAIAKEVVGALTFGSDNPSGEFSTVETIKALTLSDVTQAYSQYITPSRSYLTIVGDIKPEAAKALAEKWFSNWNGAQLTLAISPKASNPPQTEIDVVDLPNAVQSDITVINLVNLKLDADDIYAAKLANLIFGGGSNAYLFKSLREKRGFTYGAYSNLGSGRFQTTFSSNAAVRTAKTDSAVMEFLTQLKRIRTEPISSEELENAKALYNGSFALNMEDSSVPAAYARNILLNKLPADYYRNFLKRINAVTVEQVQQAADKYFSIDNARIIVVGNAAQYLKALKELPYPIEEYDRFAKPIVSGTTGAARVIK